MWFLNTKKRNFSYFFRITTLYLGRPALPWFTLQLNGGWGASHFHSSLLLLVFAVNIFRRLEPWWMENRPLRSCCSVCVAMAAAFIYLCCFLLHEKNSLFEQKFFKVVVVVKEEKECQGFPARWLPTRTIFLLIFELCLFTQNEFESRSTYTYNIQPT